MLTDKEEIIFKYSAKEKFASNELMASNVAQALGIEAAVLAGSAVVGAGAGAAGMFGFGGAGVGALAGLGLSGPPGWIVLGAIALIGTLAWAISSAVRRTDDNIEDLPPIVQGNVNKDRLIEYFDYYDICSLRDSIDILK